MAYNSINRFRRILKIQEITKENQAMGIPNTVTYDRRIRDDFDIAYSTYCNYLGINARKGLRDELAKREIRQAAGNKQIDLFGDKNESGDEEV